MSVPAVAVVGALFVMERSFFRWGGRHAVSLCVWGLVVCSSDLAATVAVLTIGPVAAGLMCTVIVKGWVALGASVPKVRSEERRVGKECRLAESKFTCNGSTSATVPPLEVEGPTLVTVRV